jgi:hypothetical protein
MEWTLENWFFLLIAGVFIGMHLLGFGCCGRKKHGNHSQEECDEHKLHSDELAKEEKQIKKSHSCCG